MYFIEYSVKRSSKLHRLTRRERDGIVIDIVEAVVGDHAVAAAPLWDQAERAEAQVRMVHYQGCWEHCPLLFLHHIGEFIAEKVDALVCRRVRSSC